MYTFGHDCIKCDDYQYDGEEPDLLNKKINNYDSYCEFLRKHYYHKYDILIKDTSFVKGICFDFFNELKNIIQALENMDIYGQKNILLQ